MQIYHYHPQTGELLRMSVARPDPAQPGEYLIPAYATRIKAPEAAQGEAVRWTDGEWETVPDNRGMRYWLPGDDWETEARVMESLGPLPEGASRTRPEKTVEILAAEVRAERNTRLSTTDVRALSDYPHADESSRLAWQAYRQALRDVPQQGGFPEEVMWPPQPE